MPTSHPRPGQESPLWRSLPPLDGLQGPVARNHRVPCKNLSVDTEDWSDYPVRSTQQDPGRRLPSKVSPTPATPGVTGDRRLPTRDESTPKRYNRKSSGSYERDQGRDLLCLVRGCEGWSEKLALGHLRYLVPLLSWVRTLVSRLLGHSAVAGSKRARSPRPPLGLRKRRVPDFTLPQDSQVDDARNLPSRQLGSGQVPSCSPEGWGVTVSRKDTTAEEGEGGPGPRRGWECVEGPVVQVDSSMDVFVDAYTSVIKLGERGIFLLTYLLRLILFQLSF